MKVDVEFKRFDKCDHVSPWTCFRIEIVLPCYGVHAKCPEFCVKRKLFDFARVLGDESGRQK